MHNGCLWGESNRAFDVSRIGVSVQRAEVHHGCRIHPIYIVTGFFLLPFTAHT